MTIKTVINTVHCDGDHKFDTYYIQSRHAKYAAGWVELKEMNSRNSVFYSVHFCPECVTRLGVAEAYKRLRKKIEESKLK